VRVIKATGNRYRATGFRQKADEFVAPLQEGLGVGYYYIEKSVKIKIWTS
jgi:hypothetical protein